MKMRDELGVLCSVIHYGLVLKARFLKELVFLVCVTLVTWGLPKTRLQHIVTAAAMNLSRMWAFWRNIPIGLTRVSSFSTLFTSG